MFWIQTRIHYEIEVRQILETELQNNETLLEYTYGSLFYSLPSVSIYAGLTSERILIIKESFFVRNKKNIQHPHELYRDNFLGSQSFISKN